MELESVGKFEFKIDAYLSDFRGKATLPMIVGYMLQSATKHAEDRAFGYSYMTEQNRAWVLSRMAIELFEYPRNDTTLVIKTWVHDVNRLFTQRYFAFENENGKQLGYAKSMWAAIDIETRKPTNVLDLKSMVDYIDKEKECPIGEMTKIQHLKDDCHRVGEFDVKYSDIDINKHLNSMKYIEHFVDVFDLDVFKEKDIKRFEINYVAEGHYGSQLDIVSRLTDDDEYIMEMRDSDKIICTTHIVWC